MANTYKVLGQVAPSDTSSQTLYTVPSSTSTVASTLTVCNRGPVGTIRVAVRPAGAAIANQHYIIYDTVVNYNDSLFLTIGLTLAQTDVVTVSGSHGQFTYNLYGSEIS